MATLSGEHALFLHQVYRGWVTLVLISFFVSIASTQACAEKLAEHIVSGWNVYAYRLDESSEVVFCAAEREDTDGVTTDVSIRLTDNNIRASLTSNKFEIDKNYKGYSNSNYQIDTGAPHKTSAALWWPSMVIFDVANVMNNGIMQEIKAGKSWTVSTPKGIFTSSIEGLGAALDDVKQCILDQRK